MKTRNLELKMSSLLLAVIMLVMLIPANAKATTDSTEVVCLDNSTYENTEMYFYLEGYENVDFKYAFSESADVPAEGFVTCTKDSLVQNVAVLNCKSEETYNYMFVKTKDEESGVKTQTFKIEEIPTISSYEATEMFEEFTKIIKVDTNQSETNISSKNGTAITKTNDQIVITDKQDANYKYQIIEIEDYNNSVENINEKARNLYDNLIKVPNEELMFNKLKLEISILDDFDTLISNAEWQEVQNMTINEPENSQKDEKYLVLIDQEDDNGDIFDFQIMTCARKDDQGVESNKSTVQKIIEKIKALPITGENIAIYIALAVILVAIVGVLFRMNKLKGKHYGK